MPISRTHHTNMDVYNRLQPDDLKQIATVAAVFVVAGREPARHAPKSRRGDASGAVTPCHHDKSGSSHSAAGPPSPPRLVHLAGHLAGPSAPVNDTERQLTALATTYRLRLAGRIESVADGLSWTASV